MHRRWTITMMLVLSFALAGMPGTGRAEETERSFRERTEQGVHYYRKKRVAVAVKVLEQALEMAGGDEDYTTLFTLARAYHDLLLLEKAIPMAQKAVDVAAQSGEKTESLRLLRTLRSRFGGVTFRKAREQKGDLREGIIHLEDRGRLINPKKKQVFEKIAARFRETPVGLPITLYLPFGSYSANRAPFSVEKGRIAEVELILYNPDEGGINPWWYLGGGAVAVAATAAAVVLLLGEPADETQSLRVEEIRFRPVQKGGASVDH